MEYVVPPDDLTRGSHMKIPRIGWSVLIENFKIRYLNETEEEDLGDVSRRLNLTGRHRRPFRATLFATDHESAIMID